MPSTVHLTPHYRMPVQVIQYVSSNKPLLSTYHPPMESFSRLKKRNRPQRHIQKLPSISLTTLSVTTSQLQKSLLSFHSRHPYFRNKPTPLSFILQSTTFTARMAPKKQWLPSLGGQILHDGLKPLATKSAAWPKETNMGLKRQIPSSSSAKKTFLMAAQSLTLRSSATIAL